MQTKHSHIDEDTIKLLVDHFYSKVRKDPELSPIFEKAIGTEIKHWEPHLEKMYAFWSSIMMGTGRYHGNPVLKHRALLPFDLSLFDQWLTLFAETASQVYSGPVAEQFILRSRQIAFSLKLRLEGSQKTETGNNTPSS